MNYTKTDAQVSYLQDRVDQLEDERRRADDAERQRLLDQRAERHEQWRENQCRADTWEEAFRKGVSRAVDEARSEASLTARIKADSNPEEFAYLLTGEPFFEGWAEAMRRAEVLYTEEMAAAQAEVEKLQAQIETVKLGAQGKAASRLEAERPDNGGIAQALRENQPEFLTNW